MFMSFLTSTAMSNAQNGTVKGSLKNADTREPIPFATVLLEGTTTGVTTDIDGNYVMNDVKPGIYNITATFLGFEPFTYKEITVSSARPTVLDFELKPASKDLAEVVVSSSRFEKSEESPLSKVSIRSAEIMRNPGGNRDISKVLQSFPGVASTVSFRNDIIIRGGAPNENRFFLDGIEVPNINHFATQGSSGGPVGLINVNFINQVEFYSGAFPASRGNSLSSVLEFKQKNGNPDRVVTNFMIGSSDIGLTFDGPLSKKSDFIFSVRRSYLQFLFSALRLPFLPTYNDAQFKINYNIDKNNTITIIGLGAIDQFRLNEGVNDGVTDTSLIQRNNYILGYLPVNEQWNYTNGIKYTHYGKNGYQNFVLSRNMLMNTSEKFMNNSNIDSDLILKYKSSEAENKFRFESTTIIDGWRWGYGVNYEYARYRNRTYNKLFFPAGVTTLNFSSELDMHKYGAYFQISRQLFENRLTLSAGVRADGNDYSDLMSNPIDQLSPRASASLRITDKWFLNLNSGRYYQLPAYTVMGYRNQAGELVNRQGLKYIRCDHVVGGIEHLPDENTKITVESFYKAYGNYPFLTRQNISLANLGSDFGVIGNSDVTSSSEGRSYGLEFLLQRTSSKGFYGIVAYTLVRSEFTNAGGSYSASSWDNRNIISLTGGKQFGKNWEVGLKFRFFDGAPFTPFDVENSRLRSVWDITRQGVFDYSKINTQRLPSNHQLDIRIDKKYYVRKKAINVYLDIQNIYNNKIVLPSLLTVVTDANNNPVPDPSDPSKYKTTTIKNESGTVLPSIGFMFEF
jgi:hypothetical protein